MIPDLDIYRSAQVLVKRHGEDAPIHAAMRADAMLDGDDLGGLARWKRVLRAVEELWRITPRNGEAVKLLRRSDSERWQQTFYPFWGNLQAIE